MSYNSRPLRNSSGQGVFLCEINVFINSLCSDWFGATQLNTKKRYERKDKNEKCRRTVKNY